MRSFTSQQGDQLKGIHIEVRLEQALEVILAIYKTIKSKEFIVRYNVKVYFSS